MAEKLLVSVPLFVHGGDGTPTTLRMVLPLVLEKEAEFGDELVVCADEQFASRPEGGTSFAVGLEFGPKPIPADLIQNALDRRTCEPLNHPRCFDKRTHLRRPFFHATDDGYDCRDLLLATIRDRLQDRFLFTLRWHFADARPDHPEGPELHQHVLALLLGLISHIPKVQRVIFRFERVQGLFAGALVKWLQEDVEIRVRAMLRLGLVETFIPMDVEEVGKTEPGVQVCDHLLWRENRGLSEKQERIEDAGMVFNHSQDNPPCSITLYQHGDVTLPVSRVDAGRDPDNFSWEEVVHMLYHIEANIHDLARTKPPEVRHLDHILSPASMRTRGNVRIQFSDFVQLHVTFLTIIGLYSRQPEVSDEWRQSAADFARLSIVIGQQHETRCISIFRSWREIRARLITNGDPRL